MAKSMELVNWRLKWFAKIQAHNLSSKSAGVLQKNSPEAGIVGKKCVSSLIMYTNLKNLHFSKSETGLQILTKNPCTCPGQNQYPGPG